MARDRHRRGRVTPRGQRPPHLRPVRDPDNYDDPVDRIIDSSGQELLEKGDALSAEMWASAMVEAFASAGERARLEDMDTPPFEEALIARCRQRRDRRAAVVAAALASVLPPPHDRLAASVAAALQVAVQGLPRWVGTIGHVSPVRTWIGSDVYGDTESLIIAFRQEGDPGELALVTLVDHNLSGQAKDAWIAPDADQVVATWRSAMEAGMILDEVPSGDVLARLRNAMAASDLWNADNALRTEEFANHRALVWARLRREGLTYDPPTEVEVPPAERDKLVQEFMASHSGQSLAGQMAGVDVEILVHYLVALRADYEGRPLRWSPIVVSRVLGDLAPRKLPLDADQAAALPAVMRAFIRFSAARTGLEGTFFDEVLAAVDRIEREFLERMGDPRYAGPAKAVLAALQARGIDLGDVDAINETLQNQEPMKLPGSPTKKRRPTAAASVEVVASAERAPVLARLELLAGFYGGGRKLTQTGQPTLADARELVKLLGTQDRFDVKIDDRVFKTKSAGELPELGFMIRWAVAAGALRKEHGKLQATVSWGKLDGKPLQRWVKAIDVLSSLGPLGGFYAHARYRTRQELLDELWPEILYELRDQAMSFEEVLDWVCERASIAYEWLDPWMQDEEHRRSSFTHDLEMLSRIFASAGILDWVDATLESDQFGFERLVGGSLHLTPVGRWWLTESL